VAVQNSGGAPEIRATSGLKLQNFWDLTNGTFSNAAGNITAGIVKTDNLVDGAGGEGVLTLQNAVDFTSTGNVLGINTLTASTIQTSTEVQTNQITAPTFAQPLLITVSSAAMQVSATSLQVNTIAPLTNTFLSVGGSAAAQFSAGIQTSSLEANTINPLTAPSVSIGGSAPTEFTAGVQTDTIAPLNNAFLSVGGSEFTRFTAGIKTDDISSRTTSSVTCGSTFKVDTIAGNTLNAVTISGQLITDAIASSAGAAITVSSAGMKFSNSVTSYVPTAFTYNEEGTFSATATGPFAAPGLTRTVSFTRRGKRVTLAFPDFMASSGGPFTNSITITGIPTRLMPTAATYSGGSGTSVFTASRVQVNGVWQMGGFDMFHSGGVAGSVNVYATPGGGTFASGSGPTGFSACSITYLI
jgi:hypothetical protein